MIAGNARWPGIGHNSAYSIDGRDYFVVHAYDAQDRGWSKLKVLDLSWDTDGWPVIDATSLAAAAR